jgi:DNA-directed RNA polymerase subunit M/transcription elongation factor TFIIS
MISDSNSVENPKCIIEYHKTHYPCCTVGLSSLLLLALSWSCTNFHTCTRLASPFHPFFKQLIGYAKDCPICANALQIAYSPSDSSTTQTVMECRSCTYRYQLKRSRPYRETRAVKPKEVDDVLGGPSAWENADTTGGESYESLFYFGCCICFTGTTRGRSSEHWVNPADMQKSNVRSKNATVTVHSTNRDRFAVRTSR